MKKLNKQQIDYGEQYLRGLSEMWGTTKEQTAKILLSFEYKHRAFFDWVNAEEFLYSILFPGDYHK